MIFSLCLSELQIYILLKFSEHFIGIKPPLEISLNKILFFSLKIKFNSFIKDITRS